MVTAALQKLYMYMYVTCTLHYMYMYMHVDIITVITSENLVSAYSGHKAVLFLEIRISMVQTSILEEYQDVMIRILMEQTSILKEY